MNRQMGSNDYIMSLNCCRMILLITMVMASRFNRHNNDKNKDGSDCIHPLIHFSHHTELQICNINNYYVIPDIHLLIMIVRIKILTTLVTFIKVKIKRIFVSHQRQSRPADNSFIQHQKMTNNRYFQPQEIL